MRRAKSYSIVDHELLHGKYLHRLSHTALALYLFLVLVGDRDGKSYYCEGSIVEILRFRDGSFSEALKELTQCGLIAYYRPYFLVQELKRHIQGVEQSAENRSLHYGRAKESKKQSYCTSEQTPGRIAFQDMLQKFREEST